MAASFKIVLHSQPNGDGTHTVTIRVTFLRKSRYFSLNRRCKKSQWEPAADRFNRTFPNWKEENDILRGYEQRAADALRTFERDHVPFSFDRFEQAVFADASILHCKTVAEYLRDVAAQILKEGRHGNSTFYMNTAAAIEAYRPRATLSDISADWLHRLEAWARSDRALGNGGLSIILRTLRAACNRAISVDKIMPRSWYPFAEYSLSHLTAAKINRALSLEDIRKIEAAPVADQHDAFAKDLFLFSFYCRGMNLADIAALRKDQIREGRIHYVRKKTHREFSVAISDKAREVIARYVEHSPDRYVFPVYREGIHETYQQQFYRKARVSKILNTGIRNIAASVGIDTAGLTFYTARHTYANSLDRLGADRRKIQDALGHSKFQTTEIYLNSFSDREIDELDKLLGG